MRPSSRLLPLILFLSLGVTTAVAQSPASGPSVSGLEEESARSSVETTPGSSVVLKEEASSRKPVGVQAENLRRYAETDALRHDDFPIQTASFELSESTVPAPQSNASNRRLLYIIGGVLVAGGAVAGILALSGDGDVIPPPSGRPPSP